VGVENTEKTSRNWSVRAAGGSVQLMLSPTELIGAEIPAGPIAGLDIAITSLPADAALPREALELGQVIIIEIQADLAASFHRVIQARKAHHDKPIVAAVRDPSAQLVRALMKAGVNDVMSLPLRIAELSAVLEQLRADTGRDSVRNPALGKIVSVVRSVGGAGGTMLATQAASSHARHDARHTRETCLFDLDIQLGNAANYLGISPILTLHDLLKAGSRVDGALLRSACVKTSTGLSLIAAPSDIIPFETVDADQLLNIIELATIEFDTVYLDMPENWTNWSLSLAARSDVVLLVVELTIASLRQAKRQLAFLESQGLAALPIHIVLNRVEKKLFRPISFTDAERALGHAISFGIANDPPLVRTALDQGVLIDEIKPGSKVAKDVEAIVEKCETLFDRSVR
jgi:pilus assembly protein CpaE